MDPHLAQAVAAYKNKFPSEIPIRPEGSPIEFKVKRNAIASILRLFKALGIEILDANRDKDGTIKKLLDGLETHGRAPFDEVAFEIIVYPPMHLPQEELGPTDMTPEDITTEHLLEIIGAVAGTAGGEADAEAFRPGGDGSGDRPDSETDESVGA